MMMKTMKLVVQVLLWCVLQSYAEAEGSGDIITISGDGSATGIPDDDDCSLTMADDEDYVQAYIPIQLIVESQPTCNIWISDENDRAEVKDSIGTNLMKTVNDHFPQCNYRTRDERVTCNENPIQISYMAKIAKPVSNITNKVQQALMNTTLRTVSGIKLTIISSSVNGTLRPPGGATEDPTHTTSPRSEGIPTSSISLYVLLSTILLFCGTAV